MIYSSFCSFRILMWQQFLQSCFYTHCRYRQNSLKNERCNNNRIFYLNQGETLPQICWNTETKTGTTGLIQYFFLKHFFQSKEKGDLERQQHGLTGVKKSRPKKSPNKQWGSTILQTSVFPCIIRKRR